MATKRKQYPSQARLRELFDYDPEGFLVWRYNPNKPKWWNTKYYGERVGNSVFNINGGYSCSVKIDSKYFNVIYLIWIYHKGNIPDSSYVKCHGNIFSGLKIEDMELSESSSLRHAGRRTNDNPNGFLGVVRKPSGYFQAKFQINNIHKELGTYETAEAAASAYDKWAFEYYGEGFIGNNSGCTNPEKYRVKAGDRPRKSKKTSSGFRGVYKNKDKWKSAIRMNGKLIHLGTLPTKEQAARAYNIAAYEHYGEHAILNDIPDPLGKLKADEEDVF